MHNPQACLPFSVGYKAYFRNRSYVLQIVATVLKLHDDDADDADVYWCIMLA